jgi:hypothetical protein
MISLLTMDAQKRHLFGRIDQRNMFSAKTHDLIAEISHSPALSDDIIGGNRCFWG